MPGDGDAGVVEGEAEHGEDREPDVRRRAAPASGGRLVEERSRGGHEYTSEEADHGQHHEQTRGAESSPKVRVDLALDHRRKPDQPSRCVRLEQAAEVRRLSDGRVEVEEPEGRPRATSVTPRPEHDGAEADPQPEQQVRRSPRTPAASTGCRRRRTPHIGTRVDDEHDHEQPRSRSRRRAGRRCDGRAAPRGRTADDVSAAYPRLPIPVNRPATLGEYPSALLNCSGAPSTVDHEDGDDHRQRDDQRIERVTLPAASRRRRRARAMPNRKHVVRDVP